MDKEERLLKIVEQYREKLQKKFGNEKRKWKKIVMNII